jgi:DNA repair protein RadD
MTATLFPEMRTTVTQDTGAPKKTPRPHQIRCMDMVRQAFREGHSNVLVQAPCGAGKTLTGGWMIEGAMARDIPCLWIADRRELVDQPSTAFWELGIPNGILMADRKQEGFRCQVASKQSLYEWCIASGKPDTLPWATSTKKLMIFIDEAHISAQTTVWAIISEYMRRVDHLWVVGFTATPMLPDGRGLGEYYSKKIIATTYAELKQQGILSPLHLKAPDIIDPKNENKIVGDAYEHWKQWGDGRKTILFARNIAQSKAHADLFCSRGIHFEHIDGTMDSEQRDEILESLKDPDGKVQGVSNYDVLSKGFDAPTVKCLILARRVGSPVLYRQMNRIQRPFKGQDAVFIDMAGTAYYHGFFPDDDIEWPFDPKETLADVRAKNRDEEREPIVCQKCYTVRRSGAVCPNCGETAKKRLSSEPITTTQGELFDVERGQLKAVKTEKDLIRAWKGLVAAFANSKSPKKYAAAMGAFKGKYGQWPKDDWPYTVARESRHTYISVLFPFMVAKKNRIRQGLDSVATDNE